MSRDRESSGRTRATNCPISAVQFFFGEGNHELLVRTAVRSTLSGAVLFTSSLGRTAGSGCRFTARLVVLA